MKKYNVGILGATGAVGREMLNVLKERNFPINELKLFASSRSAGKKIEFDGKEYTIIEAKHGAFSNIDIMLGAASNPVAIEFKDEIVSSGAVFIDNSSVSPGNPVIICSPKEKSYSLISDTAFITSALLCPLFDVFNTLSDIDCTPSSMVVTP